MIKHSYVGDTDDEEGRILATPRSGKLHRLRRGGRPPAERAPGHHDPGTNFNAVEPIAWQLLPWKFLTYTGLD